MRKALGVPRAMPVLLEAKRTVVHFEAMFQTARTQTGRVPNTAWHSLNMPRVHHAESGDGASLSFPVCMGKYTHVDLVHILASLIKVSATTSKLL